MRCGAAGDPYRPPLRRNYVASDVRNIGAPMKTYIISYLATGLIFAGIDAVWLSAMSRYLYRPMLGDLLLDTFSVPPAVIFYLLYVAGIVIFAVSPAFETGRWVTAAVNGALFGLCAYATYDLTNQATLKGWPLTVTLIDLGWGTALTAAAATLGYVTANAILNIGND